MKKIIIDTDIGDDIDDALAIALAVNSPEVEIAGVTTVFKNTGIRAGIAKNLLKEYGRGDVPVAKGIGMPLINRVDLSEIPCYSKDEDKQASADCAVNAVDFIIDRVKRDSDIIIVTIGPLTNIAAAVVKDSSVMKNTKIVMMGGMVSNPMPEWNIMCDPEAAHIVFESGIPITMVGLDVTLKCKLNDEQVNEICMSDNKPVRYLAGLIKQWMKVSRCNPILHDPLALGFILDPGLFETKKTDIRIETRGEYTRGMTVDYRNVFTGISGRFNANVCVKVDSGKFVNMFMDRILKGFKLKTL